MATTFNELRQLVRIRLLETYALTTPGSPLVTQVGTPSTKIITYKIVALNATGHSAASQGTTTTAAAATLNGTNYNQINWQAVPGATGYEVWRTATNGTAPTTTGLIGTVGAVLTFNDDGDAGDSATAPTTNTSGIAAPFWTEQELLDILILGAKDLWRAIIDLHQGHFTTIDATNVSLAASGLTLTGVPADCFRVLMIEPRDLSTTSSTRYFYFKPKSYHSIGFQAARSEPALNMSTGSTVYYDILNAGSPVVAPSIVVAPAVDTAILLRLVYVHVLPTLLETDSNPIPGESDNALVSWGVAWARAKEREDHSPDPGWFATYSTDKQSLLTALTPRQEQEEEYAEGMFEGLFDGWN